MTAVYSRDRLRPADHRRALVRFWRGHDLVDVVSRVQQAAGWSGIVLPYTRVDGRPAFPVVTVDVDAVEQRLQRGEGPVLERARLRDFAAHQFVGAPPRAVVLAGYVVVDPFSVARCHLAALRTWAPTALAVPAWSPLGAMDVVECDYFGYRVWFSDGRRAWEMDLGSTSQPASVDEGDAWQRLRDEQMFDLALRTGAVSEVGAGCLPLSR